MSKQKQPLESAATPAAVQEKKSSKKKRKVEAAQANQSDEGATAAVQAGNTQVPLRTKKQKKSNTEVTAAPAPVKETKKKKDKAAVAAPVPVPVADNSAATEKSKQKKKKKGKTKDTETAATTMTVHKPAASAALGAALSGKKAKAAQTPSPVVSDIAAVPIVSETLAAKKTKKKKGLKADPETAATAVVSQSDLAAEGVPDSKKKSSKKRKRDAVSVEGPASAPAVVPNGDVSLGSPAVANDDSAIKPKKKKSKKAAPGADTVVPDASTGVIVPAVMVSPDVVVLPAASIEAASADKQAGSGPEAQMQRTESGRAVAKGPTGARAFKRVNDDEWLGKKGAWDNSYEAKFGSSGWGAKASQTLLQVRGKDFRHEKTKKKRGSYKGGLIDNNVNSFKFESDDE